jgi:hypothetical protein
VLPTEPIPHWPERCTLHRMKKRPEEDPKLPPKDPDPRPVEPRPPIPEPDVPELDPDVAPAVGPSAPEEIHV